MFFSVVLVRPKYPRNIGMVSRAMENFGLERLILIQPKCDLNEEAREGAAQGQGPLRNAIIYNDWTEFQKSENEGPRVAFSRRAGRRRQAFPIESLSSWAPLSESNWGHLIFGTEDHGLSTDDLDHAHRTCFFDIPGPVKSMNLSHAVLYGLSQISPLLSPSETPSPPPSSAPIALPDLTLKRWLEALHFDLSQEKWNAHIALKQMLKKAAPTPKEMELLESVIQQTLRRLETKP